MNPAEAVFMCLFLMGGKMWDVDYRLPPDEWVRLVRLAKVYDKEVGRSSRPVGALNINRAATPVPPEVIAFVDLLSVGLKSESSFVSEQAHAFLTSLGIRK
jgi:hypothetical protein